MNNKKIKECNRHFISTQRSESWSNMMSMNNNSSRKESKDLNEDEIKDDHLIDLYVNMHLEKEGKVHPTASQSFSDFPLKTDNKKVRSN